MILRAKPPPQGPRTSDIGFRTVKRNDGIQTSPDPQYHLFPDHHHPGHDIFHLRMIMEGKTQIQS